MMWIADRFNDQMVNTDKLSEITVEEMGAHAYAVVGYIDRGHDPIVIDSYSTEKRARHAFSNIRECLKHEYNVMRMLSDETEEDSQPRKNGVVKLG